MALTIIILYFVLFYTFKVVGTPKTDVSSLKTDAGTLKIDSKGGSGRIVSKY